MILTTFASSSSGNCALVEGGGARILQDAGISYRRIKAALASRALTFEDVDGIVITHEHSDHIAALPMLCRHTDIPVYAPSAICHALIRTVVDIEDRLRTITPGAPFPIRELTVTAFPTPHDTPQSVGYRYDCGEALGFCTDTGCITEDMLSSLRGAPLAVIEANHDIEMLRAGSYPFALKRRILSDHGHLSNADCARLACDLAENGAKCIVLAHLSRENNLPATAYRTVRAALDEGGFPEVSLHVAPADGALTVEVPEC